jgi:hypothetical protein
VLSIKSERAKKLFESKAFLSSEKTPQMKKYPGEWDLWIGVEWEKDNVKNLSFYGTLSEGEFVLLQSMANLLIGRPISLLDGLTLRECEAFLRDRNSEEAVSGMTENLENELKKVFRWLRIFPKNSEALPYDFHSGKGHFSQLKLADKIRELKAFLNSPKILTLYENLPRPELVDVEDLTVYILAPYGSQREKSLFEELHVLGVETFQEENLNFIPEG